MDRFLISASTHSDVITHQNSERQTCCTSWMRTALTGLDPLGLTPKRLIEQAHIFPYYLSHYILIQLLETSCFHSFIWEKVHHVLEINNKKKKKNQGRRRVKQSSVRVPLCYWELDGTKSFENTMGKMRSPMHIWLVMYNPAFNSNYMFHFLSFFSLPQTVSHSSNEFRPTKNKKTKHLFWTKRKNNEGERPPFLSPDLCFYPEQ